MRYSASSAARVRANRCCCAVCWGCAGPDAGSVDCTAAMCGSCRDCSGLELVKSYGVTFQNGALISSLTVAENIQLPLREYYAMPEAALDELANSIWRSSACRPMPRASIPRSCPGA